MGDRRNGALVFSIAGLCAGTGLALGAFAADLPVLKSGLWEITRASGQGGAKHLTTMCLDESVQAQMREFSVGVAKEMCSQNDRVVETNRMTINATCILGATTVKTRSVMTFKGNTAYHTDSIASYDPPYMNMSESKSTLDGKWVGPCKPGQKPGDLALEGGKTINMTDMMKK